MLHFLYVSKEEHGHLNDVEPCRSRQTRLFCRAVATQDMSAIDILAVFMDVGIPWPKTASALHLC